MSNDLASSVEAQRAREAPLSPSGLATGFPGCLSQFSWGGRSELGMKESPLGLWVSHFEGGSQRRAL